MYTAQISVPAVRSALVTTRDRPEVRVVGGFSIDGWELGPSVLLALAQEQGRDRESYIKARAYQAHGWTF